MNIIKDASRIVFKIGTSTLTHDTGKFNLKRIDKLARVLSDFKNAGKEVLLVSSGAIAAGRSKMRIDHRPASIIERQAMSAVGQTELMRIYDQSFSMYGQTVAQVLLTKDVLDNEIARQNAENTFQMLLQMDCIPIINENDTISLEELIATTFGENDTLSAYVSLLCHADALVILSDSDGLYDSDPRSNPNATLIHTVAKIDDTIKGYVSGAGTDRGTGGFVTKIKAAEIVCNEGIPMFIVNGENPEILYDMFEGKSVGTYFMSR